MLLHRKGISRSHRGVIGVEAAIVMIAFVIVAAALAFVVLNMGFTTSQKAKTTILSSLSEASSSMQVAGKVIGAGDISNAALNAVAFPIKISSGGNHVNLDVTLTAVKYVSNIINYDNIYVGTLNGEYKSLQLAIAQATILVDMGNESFGDIDKNPYGGLGNPTYTRAFIYFPQQNNFNDVLEQGEIAVLVVVFSQNDQLSSLDKFQVEILTSKGASLTVERQIPLITSSVVDLG